MRGNKQGRWRNGSGLALLCLALQGCAGHDTESPVAPPGQPKQADTQLLELGAEALQSRPPIDQLNAYLDGFHFYNGHPHVQMEAHHYCAIVNEEVIQCVIYDGNVSDARLMGVEYIISKRLFASLPTEEKALWHSHAHEVTSGTLIAPGVPLAAETRLMSKLADTYGKTWHTWHTDQDLELPLGVPQLMMGFTADGQIDPAMLRQRDQRLGVDTAEHRRARASIRPAPVERGADAWQSGKVVQIPDPTGHVHLHSRPASAPEENARSVRPTSR
ncbi:OBAP family protein [Pseudomonas sp. Marseille-QA0332]